MIRVLHLTRDFPPRCTGGLSTAVGTMVGALVPRGVPCGVISFDGWRPKASAGLSKRDPDLPTQPDLHLGAHVLRISAPSALPVARKFATGFKPNIIHVHHSMLWKFAAELRAAIEVPAIITVHVLQQEQNRLREITGDTMSSAAQRSALDYADYIVAPSRAVAEILIAENPAQRNRIGVVPLAVATPPVELDSSASTRRSDTVLYAGRFADINGTGELFSAIPVILARVPSARFVIAGGVPENRKAEARWRRRWQQSTPAAVRERVDFTGWLDREQLYRQYRTATALISPSWFETFGLVILEAMHHEVAISATCTGAVTELITHGYTGLLARPRDIDGLARNTALLLERPDLTRRLAVAAAHIARDVFHVAQMTDSLVAIYRECGDH
ncbi:MAG: glycosyltransferase family 4 protein [Myxococcota bacterium]